MKWVRSAIPSSSSIIISKSDLLETVYTHVGKRTRLRVGPDSLNTVELSSIHDEALAIVNVLFNLKWLWRTLTSTNASMFTQAYSVFSVWYRYANLLGRCFSSVWISTPQITSFRFGITYVFLLAMVENRKRTMCDHVYCQPLALVTLILSCTRSVHWS